MKNNMGEDKGKVVVMNPTKEPKPVENKKAEKLSYEEIVNIANQLQQKNEFLQRSLMEISENNFFKRLDYLFKVIENMHAFSEDFVMKCIKEIEEVMYPSEEMIEAAQEELKE